MSHTDNEHTNGEHGDEESILVKKMSPNESLAADLGVHGIPAEAIAAGTHPIEKQEYYSHKFGLNSKFVTNKGMIRINGRNFDWIQVLERN